MTLLDRPKAALSAQPLHDAFLHAIDTRDLLQAVEARLVDAGAVVELYHLHRLSAAEMDILIHREIHQPTTTQEPPT